MVLAAKWLRMNISCQACSAKYAVPDEKVRGKKVRFRCRACGNMVLVVDALSTATNEAARYQPQHAPRGYAPEPRAYAAPFDHQQRNDFEGDDPTEERGAVHDQYEQHEQHEHDNAAYDNAPVVEQEQAFDTTTRKAAVVRQGARAKRDLFAHQEQVHTSAPSEPPPPSRSVLPNPTGERSENSVLFTLAALSGVRASSAVPAPRRPLDPRTDPAGSGLIDLKAMMADAQELPPQAVKSVFPSDPPLGAFTTSVATSPSLTRGRRGRWLGGGIAAALVLLVAIGFTASAVWGGDDTPIAAAIPAVVVEPPAPAPAPAAAPETIATNDAKSPLAAEPVAAAPKTKGKAGKGARRHGAGKAAASHQSSASTASKSAAPAAPAASDPCHCKGNLMCAMKCAS
ncbi:MAG: hypothetical protein JWM74_5862 [Myxococcaceae bacterium]|nr:hypothetical protein [Myxococcaceae bacterium]